jgi:hypothetical protein
MIELEFKNVDFYGGRKTGEPTLEARERINNILNSHEAPEQRIEPTTGTTAVRGERITATPPMLPFSLYIYNENTVCANCFPTVTLF